MTRIRYVRRGGCGYFAVILGFFVFMLYCIFLCNLIVQLVGEVRNEEARRVRAQSVNETEEVTKMKPIEKCFEPNKEMASAPWTGGRLLGGSLYKDPKCWDNSWFVGMDFSEDHGQTVEVTLENGKIIDIKEK